MVYPKLHDYSPKDDTSSLGLDYHTMSVSDSVWGIKQTSLDQERDIQQLAGKGVPFYEHQS